MYPNLGSGTTQPSAPLPSSSTLSNSAPPKPVGFSSLMSQQSNQSTPYPGGQSSQTSNPGGQSSQTPYPRGQSSQTPYPGGQSSQTPYPGGQSLQTPYPSNNQPPNTSNYSPYSLPQTGQQPTPPTGYQNPYPSSNPYQTQQGNTAYQNPYGPPQGNTGYQNPYQQQQGGYPQQQPYNPQQQQSYQNPYASNPQQLPVGGYGGYPPYNQQQQQQQQQPYQNPYASNPQQPPGGYGGYPPYNQQQPYQNPNVYQSQAGGYNANSYGSPAVNDRIRGIASRYEINDTLAQRLNILQQFEIVVLCDDSGSMNTPVEGTTGTRWDELRSIVQIVIEIGTVFDSNGVDVHFLNRPPMSNVTDPRQVVESFSQRPGGLTPLTPVLRRIFQSAASKPGSDKRLLVFVATDGAPTDASGNVDIQSLENLMRNERQANTTYVTFLACTDDDSSIAYLSQWDRTMMNVDCVDDYKTEREEIRRNKGFNFPFSFGDYVAKALLGAVDPQMDLLDEPGNNNNNNFRRF